MQIQQFTRALELVSTRVTGELSLIGLRTFLFIAQRGKCTQKDVELELKISNAAASRNVSYWADRKSDRSPGMGFIERVEGDFDRRFKELTLNAEGKKFYRDLMEKLNKEVKAS